MATPAIRTQLVTRRKVLKSNITRLKTYINGLNETSPVDELIERLERVTSSYDEFDSIQTQLDSTTIPEVEVDEDAEVEPSVTRITFEDLYFSVVALAKRRIKAAQQTNQPLPPTNSNHTENHLQADTQSQVSVNQKYDLPKMKLPVFDGDYQQWQSFHDLFKSIIHDHSTIPEVIKLCHLRSCLTGDASKIIESLNITDSNYAVAWKLLCDRYQKKRLLVSQHTRALLRLPNLSKESHMELRKFVDDARRHIEALRALKEPIDSWDTILIQILTDKLDKGTVREWEMKNNEDITPTLKDLLDFLSHRCGALEATYRTDSSTQHKPGPAPSMNTNKGKPFSKTDKNAYHKTQANIAQSSGCFKCGQPHPLYACPQFKALNISQRIHAVQELNLCTNCLKKSHPDSECKGSCRVCFQRHNTLLHHDKSNEVSTSTLKSNSNSSSVKALTTQSGYEALLGSAIINVLDHKGKPHICKALLDSGSTSNFMTKEFCQRLHLPVKQQEFEIGGIGGTCTQTTLHTKATIGSRFNAFSTSLNFLVLEKVTNDLPSLTVHEQQWIIPPNIKLADPEYYAGGTVDIIIGIGIFWELICVGQIKLGRGLPVLQKTKLGWIIAGDLSNVSGAHKGICNLSMSSLSNQVEKFWHIEENFKNQQVLSAEEFRCEEHFKENTTRADDGHFIVRYPFRSDLEAMGTSFNQALTRLEGLERRFKRDSVLHSDYSSVMNGYLDLNHMEPIPPESLNDIYKRYYIPHHPVVKQESVTTKLRVVYDASAKTSSGKSLNDLLLVGPTIQQTLFELILRFRLHQFVVTADIEKMYRQVWVHEADQHLQCILWRNQPTDPVTIYKLKTVTFGVAAAPFLAIRCLKEAAILAKDKYPLAADVIENDFYADDLTTGADSIEELLEICKQVTTVLNDVGFPLRKWCSNSSEVMAKLDPESTSFTSFVDLGKPKESKTLGVRWIPSTDTLQYNININVKTKAVTKRTILSEIAQIFDPYGLLAPAIITAKILMQQLWALKLGWDEAVPQDIHTHWLQYREHLQSLNEIKIPRQVIDVDYTELQIHGFSDASERAYGACIYIRASDNVGNVSVRLLCAKSRVAPLKQQTLPNLELCAAVLLAELYETVKRSLQREIQPWFWSDSEIVLAWLAKEPRHWNTFIANRVSIIQRLTEISNWRHVPTKTNPADFVSRGLSPNELVQNSLWWSGPPWLHLDSTHWPAERNVPADIPGVRRSAMCNHSFTKQQIFDQCSTLQDLLQKTHSISNLYQLLTGTSQGNAEKSSLLSKNHQDIKVLIRICQQEEFPTEIKYLKLQKQLDSRSKLLGLNPFLDEYGLLRVGGRLENSDRPDDQKHPMILPSSHRLTKLIIVAEHERLLHAGPQSVLSNLRLRYWIVKGRNSVKHVIRQCVICARVKPQSITPPMGHLPADRTRKSRPFAVSGVDYAGPIRIKTGMRRSQTTTKGYIAVFVCFCTKAIHLELVTSLTTEAFLSALKRFIARRGKVSSIYSDNGTNFVGAARELQELTNTLNSVNLQEELRTAGIKWHFIPPRSPHFGGLWEAGVKSVKHHLRRVLGESLYTFEEYYTLLTQIEACLNSRPITYLSDDPTDPQPLTPGHFLIGEALVNLPEEETDITNLPTNRLNVWEQLQKLKQHFWKRWHVEYLSSLQERTKWQRNSTNLIKVNDVVLMKDENLPPLKWLMGKVSALHPGKDGVARVTTVTTDNGEFKRAITKLCVLPREDGSERDN